MDLRLSARALAAALALALLLTAGRSTPAAAQEPESAVSEQEAIRLAKHQPEVVEATREHPDLEPSASRNDAGDWEVGFFAAGEEPVLVVVSAVTGKPTETWTGYQVAWKMARGYPGAFGHKLNAPYVWIPLCLIFVAGLLDWRRLRRIAHLDLLVIVAGFGLSHFFFNRGDIGVSVPLAYPALVYLLARMLWIGFRGGGGGLKPSVPIAWLAVAALFLVGFRLGLDVADSNVIDVGYSGVIGADRIVDGETLYGNFPEDDYAGDTYGPMAYYTYVPFEQIFPWSGSWDDLPAAHAAAIFFDLATLAGLFLFGRRFRAGPAGMRLGVTLAFAWAACPYTAFALESNTNDVLVSALLVGCLLVLSSPPARGAMLALASLTKFAPLVLTPLFATYRAAPAWVAPPGGPPAASNAGGAAAGGSPAVTGPVARPARAGRAPLGGPAARAVRASRAALSGPKARAVGLFVAAFAGTTAVLMAQTLIDPGLHTFLDRTLSYQMGRDSPFSVWGQEPSLEWLHTVIKVGVGALALLVAFLPRRRDAVTVAALGAALLIGLEITVDHWFYLYIPWFLPFLFIALLARSESREESGPRQPARREPVALPAR